MAYPVKKYHGKLRGAPTLNGTQSSFKNLLKTVLFDGFGEVTLVSLIVTNKVARATTLANSSFAESFITAISGADTALANGEQRVLESGSDWFTFALDVPDGPITGTIKARYAPVGGWKVEAESTNVMVLKSLNSNSSGLHYYIDDTHATHPTLRIIDGFTTITDLTRACPTPTTASFIVKSTDANTTAKFWRLYADDMSIIYMVNAYTAMNTADVERVGVGTFFLGDYVHRNPAIRKNGTVFTSLQDYYLNGGYGYSGAYSAILSGSGAANESVRYVGPPDLTTGFAVNRYLARTHGFVYGHNVSGPSAAITSYRPQWPQPYSREFTLSSVRFYRAGDNAELGRVPGIYPIYEALPLSNMPLNYYVNGTGALANRRLDLILLQTASSQWADQSFFIDSTGPWR